jgi:hypothetical protein
MYNRKKFYDTTSWGQYNKKIRRNLLYLPWFRLRLSWQCHNYVKKFYSIDSWMKISLCNHLTWNVRRVSQTAVLTVAKPRGATTLSIMTLGIMTLMPCVALKSILLHVVMLNDVMLVCHRTDCSNLECLCAVSLCRMSSCQVSWHQTRDLLNTKLEPRPLS